MKIIGKTDEGYLCSLDEDEIRFICYGDKYAKDINIPNLLGKSVKINDLFEKCREIESFKNMSHYSGVRGQLEKLLEALTKVEKFVAKLPKTKP